MSRFGRWRRRLGVETATVIAGNFQVRICSLQVSSRSPGPGILAFRPAPEAPSGLPRRRHLCRPRGPDRMLPSLRLRSLSLGSDSSERLRLASRRRRLRPGALTTATKEGPGSGRSGAAELTASRGGRLAPSNNATDHSRLSRLPSEDAQLAKVIFSQILPRPWLDSFKFKSTNV